MSERKILLVRHGRSAHGYPRWIDLDGFLRWREAYDAAGIDALDQPPRELREMAREAGVVATSDTTRAVDSARLLAPEAEIVISPLLRELTLAPPNLRHIRLPLAAWALLFGVRMLLRPHQHITPAEHARARETARWLEGLAEEHGRVVVVTHASFRAILGKVLESAGWEGEVPRRKSAHWSVWVFTRTQARV